jgi:hypothetical protein
MDEYITTRQEILDTLAKLTDAQWVVKVHAPWEEECTVAELLNGLAWHESDEHLKSIRNWKETEKPR